jgi:hypothetical protein
VKSTCHRTEKTKQRDEGIEAFAETIEKALEIARVNRWGKASAGYFPEACLWKDLAPPETPALDRTAVDVEFFTERRQPPVGKPGSERRDEDDDRESIDPSAKKTDRRRCRAAPTHSAAETVALPMLRAQVTWSTRLSWIVGNVEPAAAKAPTRPCLLGQVRIDTKEDGEKPRVRENSCRQFGSPC